MELGVELVLAGLIDEFLIFRLILIKFFGFIGEKVVCASYFGKTLILFSEYSLMLDQNS